jgi:LPS-assembly lipoprotein
MRAPGLAAVSLVAVLVAGCGFQLRGATPLSGPMAAPWLEVPDRYTPFHRELVASLESSGARLAPGKDAATAIVRIHVDEHGRDVLSISARNTPQEYEVYYLVEYSVEAGGEEILPRQRLRLTRDYAYDDTAVLAKQHEEDDLLEALARDLAVLVTGRLSAL